jgi:hypothetical protein
MAKSKSSREILVCGHPAAWRVKDLLPMLGEGLSVKGAHTRAELLKELGSGQQAVCIIEHEVPPVDPLKEVGQFLAKGATGRAKASLLRKLDVAMSRRITAYELLPELVNRSPYTKFVITSHTRGFGLSPQQHASYKEHPEVVKVMGFVNGWGNTVFLLKLFSRVYFGKTWKQYSNA